ncbi:MAG: hypothetical protein F6J93_06485 [Oscillatoria sp. SIO1A7]|nr:hypothetical protein [Oscillatoria sp. SIO1A7]
MPNSPILKEVVSREQAGEQGGAGELAPSGLGGSYPGPLVLVPFSASSMPNAQCLWVQFRSSQFPIPYF